MPERVIGSIYPAALIGRTPLFGRVYMPYRLIFTTERVVAFHPDARKEFRSGVKLFKVYRYNAAKWRRTAEEAGREGVVFSGGDGMSDDMLQTDTEHGYGSLTYAQIGGIILRPGPDREQFSMLFRPADKVLLRGLEFCTTRAALDQVRALLAKTSLSGKVESQL